MKEAQHRRKRVRGFELLMRHTRKKYASCERSSLRGGILACILGHHYGS